MRIIVLTIFKLNDPMVNKLLLDLPFCSFFAHLGCYLKDQVIMLDQAHNPASTSRNLPFPASGVIKF
jgi:hypothetical protein